MSMPLRVSMRIGAHLMKQKLAGNKKFPLLIELEPLMTFRMRGLGYTNPEWGHGRWHGEQAVGSEEHRVEELDNLEPWNIHIQQVMRAQWGDHDDNFFNMFGLPERDLDQQVLNVQIPTNASVQIDNPRRSESRTPIAVIPLVAVAEDDFGISSLKLIVDRLGDKKHWEIPLVQTAKPTTAVNWTKVEGSGDFAKR